MRASSNPVLHSDERESIADSGVPFLMTRESDCTLEEEETSRKPKVSCKLKPTHGRASTTDEAALCVNGLGHVH